MLTCAVFLWGEIGICILYGCTIEMNGIYCEYIVWCFMSLCYIMLISIPVSIKLCAWINSKNIKKMKTLVAVWIILNIIYSSIFILIKLLIIWNLSMGICVIIEIWFFFFSTTFHVFFTFLTTKKLYWRSFSNIVYS